MLLCEWLDQWFDLITPIRSPRTVAGYKQALKHAPVSLLQLQLEAVDAPAWQLAVNQVAASWPRQAQLMHAALRSAWRMGQRLRKIPLDHAPWQFVACPSHQSRPIVYLKPEEMSSYVRAVKGTGAALPLLLMLLLGLRRGEALGLKWSQIDERSMILRIDTQIVNGKECKPKSRASVREVPICAEILDLIQEYGDKTSRLLYNGGVRRVYSSHKKALGTARLPGEVTLHGLRHSCATAALAAGVPVTAVQHLLGHSHYSTTADIYSHALINPQRNAVEKLVEIAS